MGTASHFSLPVLFVILASAAGADQATQTSWTGGPGVQGPVGMPPGWGESFWSSLSVEYAGQSGLLTLTYPAVGVIQSDVFEAFTCGDIDGDGDIDVASLDWDWSGWWFENDGSGSGWTPHSVPALFEIYYVDTFEAADMDQDDDTDLFVSGEGCFLGWAENLDGAGLAWSYNDLSETAIAPAFSSLMDADGDGDTDIVNSYGEYDHLRCLENLDGSGLYWSEHVLHGTGCGFSCAADIDGDGDPDLAAESQAELRWYRNDGLASEWPRSGIAFFNYPERVDAFDIDGDGDQDLVTTAVNEDEVLWFENANGAGTLWNEHVIDTGLNMPKYVASDDFDGDGYGDLICGPGYYAAPLMLYMNTGTGWTETVLEPSTRACVLPSDIDSDGTTDLLALDLDPPESIRWWRMGYPERGWLESSILYLGCDPGWGGIGWNAATPSGTSVSFQVRASDDFTQMGAWSDTISAPGSVAGIIPDNASYLQYRALLGSSGQDDTPSLNDVTVTWNNLGIPGEALPQSFTLFSPCPNPVRGGMSVTFSIPAEAVVELTVYDLAGRAVFEAGRAEYQEGSHEVMLGDLPPGVYLVAGRSDGIRRTARFTVLK